MAYGRIVAFEALREIAFGGIGAAYAALGPATTDYARLITIHNTSDADVYITTDLRKNEMRIAAGSARVFDWTTNKVRDDGLMERKGTVFYLKQTAMGAPTQGNVWIEVIYADGGI
jgi:hypothetical protein